jgi:membrane-associated protein
VCTVSNYLDQLSAVPAAVVYIVVAGVVFGESSAMLGVVLPGELVLLAGGTVTALGHASLTVLMISAAIGAVTGDAVGYVHGRRLGPALRTGRIGRWIGGARWTHAEDVMDRHGAAVVVVARWVGVLRSLVPAVAGVTGMPPGRYLLFNAAGGTVWVVGVCGLGFVAGNTWGASTLSTAAGIVLVGVVTAVLIHTAVRRHRRVYSASSAVSGRTFVERAHS